MTQVSPSPNQGVGKEISDQLARRTLRASLATSRNSALLVIALGLAGSWLIIYFAGGVNHMVPHWYYVPILFAAARFGPLATLVVALIAGMLAGPLTYGDVASHTPQDWSRWMSRAGFFLGIGQLMAWLVTPSLHPIGEELHLMREEFSIRKAIANNEFFLRYQPIFSLKSGTFVGAEALIRWQHPTRGELSPAAFMDVVESSSLIFDLSDFVIEEACRQAAEWRAVAMDMNKSPWYIAINLSGRDLGRPDLALKVSNALKTHQLSPECLHIELTESVMLLTGATFQLLQIKKLGVKLVVDDFGTGYSSLSYLHKFPFDILKIDRSLINDLGPSSSGQALAKSIVLLAKSLGLTTVAEGLENAEQFRIGKELGFDSTQGFYFARPMEADKIPQLIISPVPMSIQAGAVSPEA
ncbi:MAG: EAL domain-containing protein [Gammaproteobacteria bacterium]